MPSIFSAFRHRSKSSSGVTASLPNEIVSTARGFTPGARAITTFNSAPSVAQMLTNMLDTLRVYFPTPAPPLPDPGISAVSVKERTVGTSNWLGIERRDVIGELARGYHARVIFLTLAGFLAVFDVTGDPLELGDWDENDVANSYEPRVVRFNFPIRTR